MSFRVGDNILIFLYISTIVQFPRIQQILNVFFFAIISLIDK